jgi:hypothetical protein
MWRSNAPKPADWAPPGISYGPCNWRQQAICGQAGCATDPTSCVSLEKLAGHDGAACVVVQ